MIGYYKLDEETLKELPNNIRNIEDNIYDLCFPLIVEKESDLPKDLLYLYKTLNIPILTITEFKNYDDKDYKELKEFIARFSSYLKINITIELDEEGKLGHLLRVGKYAKELSEIINLPQEEINKIYIAALFHDIGKSKIPREIISKKGRLTDEEFKIIKKHSVEAKEILEGFLEDYIINMVLSHHERMDKSGYAKGVVPDLAVQIIGIADSYDAIVSSRVYHKGESREAAFQELLLCTKPKKEGGKGKLYNYELVKAFIANEKENKS